MVPKLFQVDAFTSEKFKGNPAAVCLLEKSVDGDWMQAVAAEMNLSETAFIQREADGFGLRWFTPKVEVDLCGHATLATAHILYEEGILQSSEAGRFHTRSGLLKVTKDGDWIEMDFPAEPPERSAVPEALCRAIGVKPIYAGKNRFDYLIQVGSEEEVRNLNPDYSDLRKVADRGVIVTSFSESPKYDFISRFFAPAIGIDEDPVTGSAHCCLGPFWMEQLKKTELTAYQASSRGGVVKMRMSKSRIFLQGQAVTVLIGELE